MGTAISSDQNIPTKADELREGKGYQVNLFELISEVNRSNTQHYQMPVGSRKHGNSIKYLGH